MGLRCFKALAPLVYVLLFSVAAGCSCKGEMRRFDITVSLDKSDRALGTSGIYPSVEVDAVGVSENDLQVWTDKHVNEFFAPNSDARNDPATYRRVILLGQDQQTQTLSLDDKKIEALWDGWEKQKVMYLVLLSNYPRLDTDVPGEADPRRRIIPLTCERWEREKELRILVRHDGLRLETQPLPKKQ
jgi:hypothetical protein